MTLRNAISRLAQLVLNLVAFALLTLAGAR